MPKGSQNDRNLCRQWSRWWSEGLGINPPRNDIFWRTAGSGARARTRKDSGQNVKRGYGDMMAEDPIGQPLIDKCTFEFKKGYPKLSIDACINSSQKMPKLIQFLLEAEKDAKDAGTYPVLVIHQDRKKPIIGTPASLYQYFVEWHGSLRMRDHSIIGIQDKHLCYLKYYFIILEDFFYWVNPQFFQNLDSSGK